MCGLRGSRPQAVGDRQGEGRANMNHPAIAGLLGALLQAALLAGPTSEAVSSRVEQDAQRIEDSAAKWRFTTYYDQKKRTYACRTAVSSGDKRADRAFCQAMVVCYNRLKDDHNYLLNMKGVDSAIHAVAREFYRKRSLCFQSEIALLGNQLANERASKVEQTR